MMKHFILWFKTIRPQTLFQSIAPVGVGLLVANIYTKLDGLLATITMLCAISIQVFANLTNDYYDYKKGADEKERVGFTRGLAEGTLSIKSIRNAILISLAITIVSGIYLIYRGGWVIFLIGIASIFFAWIYTATRYSLAYLGIADIFVFLFFGVIATTGTTYLQIGGFSVQSFLAGTASGVISMGVLIINNLRDRETDKQVGKKTIPVRFGRKVGEAELVLCSILSLVFSYLAFGLSFSNLIFIPTIIVALQTIKAKGKIYNKCLIKQSINSIIYMLLVMIDVYLH